jgi:hypothetical protein
MSKKQQYPFPRFMTFTAYNNCIQSKVVFLLYIFCIFPRLLCCFDKKASKNSHACIIFARSSPRCSTLFLSRRCECAANDSKLHFYDAITPSKSRVTLLFVINSARVARAGDNLIGLIRLQSTATRCSIHSCLGHVGN